VALALLKTFNAISPAGIPGLTLASIDARVCVMAVVLVVVTGIGVGVWPAMSVLRAGAMPGLSSSGTASPAVGPHVRFALVTTQVALTLTLLGSSALLLRSLWNVVHLPLGFDAERVITLSAGLSATTYATPEQRAAFFEQLLARARSTPGAVSAALTTAPPPLGVSLMSLNVDVEGRSAAPGTRHPPIRLRQVSAGYFETFRIPSSSGRTFRSPDDDGEPAVVLSESAERILFAGERALGRRVRLGEEVWHTVVGVTADIRNGPEVTAEPAPEVFVIARSGTWPRAYGYLALRTMAAPADADAFLRQIVHDLDPLLPVTVQAVEEDIAQRTQRPRFIAWLLSAFAALALLLAAAGLYSVASYLVAQRRRDIGVRIAIGAAPRDVARQVVGEAGRWIVAGVLLGCALGWTATHALQSQLYEVQALDSWSWTVALLALILALAMAVCRPAWRAAHVDPIAALRAE
jgi:predicted permease